MMVGRNLGSLHLGELATVIGSGSERKTHRLQPQFHTDALSRDKANRKRICIVSTVPFVLRWFMAPHINLLSREYDVTLVASGSAADLAGLLGDGVSFFSMQIERKISPIKDLVALLGLWRLFRKERFDCVHSIMPKAGLLAMVAARLARVPHRLHTFTGQVWATKKGPGRTLLKLLDKVLVANATRVLADGHSQRQFLIENTIVKPDDITVLADGSFGGGNVQRCSYHASARERIRKEFHIPGDSVVFLFLGRLNKDKGLLDLSRAFATVASVATNAHMLIVGPDEDGLEADFAALAQQFPGRVHRFGYTDYPEDFLSAADVLCLPSYREGFPNVPLQAAAVGLPTLGSRIYGITDAVEDGVTGMLHEPAAVAEIADAMQLLAANESLRRRLGYAARARVLDKFSEERVTRAFFSFYQEMFSASN